MQAYGSRVPSRSSTIAKIARGGKLSARVLQRMADYLHCAPELLCEELADNPLLQRLREEKTARISGGIYHELQVRMTYNSNHTEGSRLTEEQTRMIFETATLDGGDGVPVDEAFYYRGLANWPQEHGWLTDSCLDGQDTFQRLLEQFDIK